MLTSQFPRLSSPLVEAQRKVYHTAGYKFPLSEDDIRASFDAQSSASTSSLGPFGPPPVSLTTTLGVPPLPVLSLPAGSVGASPLPEVKKITAGEVEEEDPRLRVDPTGLALEAAAASTTNEDEEEDNDDGEETDDGEDEDDDDDDDGSDGEGEEDIDEAPIEEVEDEVLDEVTTVAGGGAATVVEEGEGEEEEDGNLPKLE